VKAGKIRLAVVGVGDFGRNHVRVYRELEEAELVGVVDADAERSRAVAAEFHTEVLPDLTALAGRVDAVSLAVPTVEHARIGCPLLEQGIDLLVEKPMAASLAEADQLIVAARRNGRVLQVGHLERFNPAVVAVEKVVSRPLFFEAHRLGVFSPRSLDVDVVYDVMIHDLDIVLALVNAPVADLKAVGIPILTDKVDIAHARIEFLSGAVANLTASRVSTEQVRKLRFFQEHEYISIDYARQDALRVRVQSSAGDGQLRFTESPISGVRWLRFPSPGGLDRSPKPGTPSESKERTGGPGQTGPETGPLQFGFEKLPTEPEEPLRAELRAFLESVRTRKTPRVDGIAGRRALELADRVMAGILEHARRVQRDVPVQPESR
jgi:predicted dehydrogenase